MKRVYAAIAGDGLVKVGSSISPGFRVQSMKRRGNLALVYQSEPSESGQRIEKIAHRLLALSGKHVSGEWFSASIKEVEDAIARAERIARGEEMALLYRGKLAPANGEFSASDAPSREGKVNLAIWTDAELRKAVRQAALDLDIGIAEFVETAIREKLAAHLRKHK